MTTFRQFAVLIILLFSAMGFANAQLKVATLHPLMTDLAEQVGGDFVEVVGLIDAKADPHHFQPSPKELLKAKGATLYLASGKGMESYLDKLRNTLGNTAEVLEVGRTIPSMKISGRDSQFVCCPNHTVGAIDPHWWHKVKNMQKAARVLASSFGKADPANKAVYAANAAAYSKRLDVLNSWIKREVSRIPRDKKILATAHAAFGYFCDEYGFKALPIKGLTANGKTSANYQAEAIQQIRKNKVNAIFPEVRANPKSLAIISQETGVKLGGTLVADGASSYEAMMQGNVKKIVQALAQ
ncbi:MAG: metal ABC transporter substrate-binding protein [Akkermansiaceae bacterium]